VKGYKAEVTTSQARIIAGNKVYQALGHLMKKIYISVIKSTSLKTIIRQVVACGVEPWTLTNKMVSTLFVLVTWARKILRQIYGPTYETGKWRMKMIQDINEGKGKVHPRTGHEGPEGK
jgi:hypothetical protein